jgi:hypothetical protein
MPTTLAGYLNKIINNGASDDREIIDKAMIEVPREVLDQHIRGMVRAALAQVWHQRRRANGVISGPNAQGREHPGVKAKNRAGVHSGRSPKVAAVRAALASGKLAAWYRDELWTGTRKVRLGDATYEDLTAVSNYYDSTAAANTRMAEQVRRIAVLVLEHKVSRVSELPETVALALAGE